MDRLPSRDLAGSRLPPIDQYSSLLPPVGVWTVSQLPVWGTFLSEPLRIVALVGRYPANKLMRRMPILRRNHFLLTPVGCPTGVPRGISPDFSGLSPCEGRLPYVLLTRARSPAEQASLLPAAPRLACVRPVASVHPEPGSNSPLLLISFFFFSKINKASHYDCFAFHGQSLEAPVP